MDTSAPSWGSPVPALAPAVSCHLSATALCATACHELWHSCLFACSLFVSVGLYYTVRTLWHFRLAFLSAFGWFTCLPLVFRVCLSVCLLVCLCLCLSANICTDIPVVSCTVLIYVLLISVLIVSVQLLLVNGTG